MALLSSKEIHDKIVAKQAEAQSIVDLAEEEKRDLTQDEQSAFDVIMGVGEEGSDNFVAGEIDKLNRELDRAKKREKLQAQRIAEDRQAQKLQDRVDTGDLQFAEKPRTITVPARAKAASKLRAYTDERDAYVAGQAFMAAILGKPNSQEWCRQNIPMWNTMTEGVNTKGGFLVPEEMQRTLLRLREARSVFASNARNYPMGSDSTVIPRPINDVTAYWVAEAAEITASDADLAGAELTAKKLAALTKVSTELDEDSIVDIGDMVTASMAYALADKVDRAGFLGDGTSTYGGFTGLANALHANAVVDAASGNDSALELDLADFEAVLGALPQYPGIQPAWYMHSAIFYASCARLMNAAGGNAVGDIADGTPPRFLGYPVRFTQVMPSTTGTLASTIVAYLGDLSLGCTLGTRRSVTTQVSVDRYFENDLIGIKATERCAVLVHETGATINERPVIALKTAA